MNWTYAVQALFATLTLLGSILVALYTAIRIVSYWYPLPHFQRFRDHVGRNAAKYGLLIAGGATVGSLFFSEVMGWPPCMLCWYQRIFMYPLVVLFLIDIWKGDNASFRYVPSLVTLGGIFAGYHVVLHQLARLNIDASCGAVSQIPCVENFTFWYGYITIPVMAFTAFALLSIIASDECQV